MSENGSDSFGHNESSATSSIDTGKQRIRWHELPPVRPLTLPTLAQVLNTIKIAVAVLLSLITRRPWTLGLPTMLMVEPTTACQLKCPHCPTGRGDLSRPDGRMPLENFRALYDSLNPAPIRLQLWNQGEPLVHPEIHGIIRHATTAGSRVVLSTNVEALANQRTAEAIVRSGLHTLILSLDGASAESHVKYRVGGKWDRVERGVRNVAEAKAGLGLKYPVLQWQFLLFKHNLHERDEAMKLAKEWGADEIVFKTVQLESFEREDGEQWLPDDERLRRYVLKDNKWVLKRVERPFCARIYGSAVVLWDGTVVPCCFDKDGDFVLGNAIENGFTDVWKSSEYRMFRQRILTEER
ncbi:MAG TPA: radical SAM protein, partial [Bacteroidetes bacterium]|nr:radical SAM protein [Bacteroidota bacterium]HEX05016.1 radical SAM protein [Bacteroidota bacterium]